MAAVLCQAASIAVAHNLDKDQDNRPLECNVHNIDSSSIKLNPKVERVRAVVEKNRKHYHTIQVAAEPLESKYLNVRFLPHAVCDGTIVSVTVLVPCTNMQKNTIVFQRTPPISSRNTEVFIAATKTGHLNHEQFKQVYKNIIVPGMIYSRDRLLCPEMRMYSLSPLSKSPHVHVASSDAAETVAKTPANQNLFTRANISNKSDNKMNDNRSNSNSDSEFEDNENEDVESTSDDDSAFDVESESRSNYYTKNSTTADDSLSTPSDSPVDMPQKPEMILWLDGEPAQIKSIMSPDMLRYFKENSVTVGKLNKNRSALEQPLDVCPNGFNTLHHIFEKKKKFLTGKATGPNRNPKIKELMEDALDKGGLASVFDAATKKTIANMIADLHEAMPYLWSPMSVKNSFTATGLNPTMSSGEVLDQLIRTKRGEEMSGLKKRQCRSHLAGCIEHVKEHGRVTNEYLRTHFPDDVPAAKTRKKDEDLLTLCQSQSTILTHAATVARRVTREEFQSVYNEAGDRRNLSPQLTSSGLQCPSGTCQGETCVCTDLQMVQRNETQQQKQEKGEKEQTKKEEKQRKQEQQRKKKEEVQRKKEERKKKKEEDQRKKQEAREEKQQEKRKKKNDTEHIDTKECCKRMKKKKSKIDDIRLELIKLSKQKGKKNKRDTKCEGCSIYFMRLADAAKLFEEDVEKWWKCGACKKQYCVECKRKFTADVHGRACTANRKNAYKGHQHSLYTKHTHTKHSLTRTHTHTSARAHTHKHNAYSKREC